MQRLSLAELKAQKNNVVANLEAIKGGNAATCHCGCKTKEDYVCINGKCVKIDKN